MPLNTAGWEELGSQSGLPDSGPRSSPAQHLHVDPVRSRHLSPPDGTWTLPGCPPVRPPRTCTWGSELLTTPVSRFHATALL